MLTPAAGSTVTIDSSASVAAAEAAEGEADGRTRATHRMEADGDPPPSSDKGSDIKCN